MSAVFLFSSSGLRRCCFCSSQCQEPLAEVKALMYKQEGRCCPSELVPGKDKTNKAELKQSHRD